MVLGNRAGPSTRGHWAVLKLMVVSCEPRVAPLLPVGLVFAFQLLLARAALISVAPAWLGGRDPLPSGPGSAESLALSAAVFQ